LFLRQQQLELIVCNSAAPGERTNMPYYGGIGLENVQRRLDLIYPGKYQLDIENKGDTFETRLILQLTEPLQMRPVQKSA